MRSKTIPLGIFNIVVTPHKKDGSTYRELFKALSKIDRSVNIRGDEHAFIASCSDLNANSESSDLSGEIHKFTDIGRDDWENVVQRKPATPEDMAGVVIPEHMKPNSERFRYFFFPKEHRLVVQMSGEKRSISHAAVKKLLDTLLQNKGILKRFPMVDVSIEQEPEKLRQIFELPLLHSLLIEIRRPNPGDDFDLDDERFVEHLLLSQNARKEKLELFHAPGLSLKPNAENRKLARAAASNGKVVAKGRDLNNQPTTIDTSEHPVKEPFRYRENLKISFVDQMLGAARALVDRIIGKANEENEPKS